MKFDDETVRLVPCERYVIPLDGDMLTCWRCGWWASEHDDDAERWV